MNIEKLKYFVDLVDTGSFTKTGKKNFVSQTSISQNINSLEKHFSCVLIDRSQMPVKPTEAGKRLYRESLKVIQQFDLLERQMADFLLNIEQIKIEYTSIIDIEFLTKFLSLFKKEENSPKIEIEKVPLKEAAHNLKLKKFDFCITFDSEFCDEPDIEYLPLFEGAYVVAVSKNHPLYHFEEISIEELYKYPIVMLSKNMIGKSYDLMIENCKKDGFDPIIERVVEDIETELFEIETKNLIGFFPKNYPITLGNSEIKFLPISGSSHRYQIVLAYLKSLDHRYLLEKISFL